MRYELVYGYPDDRTVERFATAEEVLSVAIELEMDGLHPVIKDTETSVEFDELYGFAEDHGWNLYDFGRERGLEVADFKEL